MVKKKVIKKKIDVDSKIKKSVVDNEEKQLRWLFIIVGIVFAIILVSYFSNESSKSFDYSGAGWKIEDYKNLKIYHGIFPGLTEPTLNYNIFLRIDPRDNNVVTSGIFNKFKYGGVISLGPKVDRCRGELSRVIFDLGAFLRQGVGVGPLISASTDIVIANESNRAFIQCDTISNRTIVILKLGNSSIVQDSENPFCYIIKAKDCNDVSSVERFIVKTVDDFNKEN